MQQNDKSYTFLLSHKSKSRIYITRVDLPKTYLHLSTVGLLLFLGLTSVTIGLSGFVKNRAFAQTVFQPTPPVQMAEIPAQNVAPDEQTANSGGPADNDAAGDASESDVEIAVIAAKTLPANLPTMWAHLGKINNEFGFRRNPFGGRAYEFHPGVDIDGERGDLIVAPAGGTVISAGYKGGYGNMVEIDHGSGLTTRYGHLSKIESAAGDTVTRGQLIGYIGSTGRSTGPHLHYELRIDDRPINPRAFLPPEPTDLTKIVKK
jgi:murein DD-endopeptidase MepM/ murein hydrolase activator NlpD